MFSFDLFLHVTQGKVIAENYHFTPEQFLTDSRKLFDPKACVFVAIRGKRHDGHDYITPLFEKGVRQFIVEKEASVPKYILRYCAILVVDDAVRALQQIAAFHRKQFDYPVIGVTGSNGKTIIKEWLGQLLEDRFKVVKSPKSYNSQLGVPLSVLQMTKKNNLAVFEAGISTVGEMEKLRPVIDPTIGIYTNIGSAHDEGFSDRREKAIEKWKLFHDCATVIHCADHEQVRATKPETVYSFTWGKDPSADVYVQSVKKKGNHAVLELLYDNKPLVCHVSFSDDASLENVMHCISAMLLLGYSYKQIKDSLSNLTVVEMRLELKKGINNCYLVDDSYNNDLGGLQVAIDFLKNQPGTDKRIIISDILQSGLEESELCYRLNEILEKNEIRSVIGIGPILKRNAHLFPDESTFYETTDHFMEAVPLDNFRDETILIKGARNFMFEKISRFLSEKIHGTVLEINLDALIHNLNFYRSKISFDTKLMVMVKAAAYGNGSHEIATLLQYNRVDYLAVAYADEGVELRKHGIDMPIMVMNVGIESFGNIIKYNLEPEVYSLFQLERLIAFTRRQEKSVKIHIKIDSGMHRLGFEEKHIDKLVSLLKGNPVVETASIYSHLAGADEEKHNKFSQKQVRKFLKSAKLIEEGLGIKTLKHILNSAGILRFPEFQLDMVRLGIGLYGFEANQKSQDDLLSVSTLKTVISQIKEVPKGETIGYGRKGLAKRDTKIATVAIGYADGFSRAFSNGKISLSVNGQFAPVIGNICMDMCMLDITGIDAIEGDEVIVFGEEPTIKQLADAIDTIPYEILTGISSRVPRVFFTN